MENAVKKIALIGAGAVGAYFIWGLQELIQKKEVELLVIAQGSRKQRLRENGVRINGKTYFPEVKTPEEAGEMDLILVATKYSGLPEAINMLPAMVGENTYVMSLLNGVDSEEKIQNKIGEKHVLYSLMRITSKRDDNGITFDEKDTMGLYYGAVNEEQKTVIWELEELWNRTPIDHTVVEDIRTDIWKKYASNVANNLPQAILQVPSALYSDSEHGIFLATKLWEEVRQVAAAKGIILSKKPVLFNNVSRNSKFSTLQDIEAGRHTEVDMFAGYMMEMAQELGISVPYCEYTFHALKALEEKNDGKFL